MATRKKQKGEIDWNSFSQFVEEFRDESDRAAVVLGAAKLDLVLYQILQAYLLPTTTGKDELLDGDSPLGTFSSKINISYRLGLLDSSFARALHLVRKIRNAFAHDVSGCSLTTGAHSDRVRELTLPFKPYKFYAAFKRRFFKDQTGPGIDFRVTLAIMVGRLENLLLNVEVIGNLSPKPLIRPDWKKEVEEESNKGINSDQ